MSRPRRRLPKAVYTDSHHDPHSSVSNSLSTEYVFRSRRKTSDKPITRKKVRQREFRRSRHLQDAMDRIHERREQELPPRDRPKRREEQEGIGEALELFSEYDAILDHLIQKNQRLKSYTRGKSRRLPHDGSCGTEEVLDNLEILRRRRGRGFVPSRELDPPSPSDLGPSEHRQQYETRRHETTDEHDWNDEVGYGNERESRRKNASRRSPHPIEMMENKPRFSQSERKHKRETKNVWGAAIVRDTYPQGNPKEMEPKRSWKEADSDDSSVDYKHRVQSAPRGFRESREFSIEQDQAPRKEQQRRSHDWPGRQPTGKATETRHKQLKQRRANQYNPESGEPRQIVGDSQRRPSRSATRHRSEQNGFRIREARRRIEAAHEGRFSGERLQPGMISAPPRVGDRNEVPQYRPDRHARLQALERRRKQLRQRSSPPIRGDDLEEGSSGSTSSLRNAVDDSDEEYGHGRDSPSFEGGAPQSTVEYEAPQANRYELGERSGRDNLPFASDKNHRYQSPPRFTERHAEHHDRHHSQMEPRNRLGGRGDLHMKPSDGMRRPENTPEVGQKSSTRESRMRQRVQSPERTDALYPDYLSDNVGGVEYPRKSFLPLSPTRKVQSSNLPDLYSNDFPSDCSLATPTEQARRLKSHVDEVYQFSKELGETQQNMKEELLKIKETYSNRSENLYREGLEISKSHSKALSDAGSITQRLPSQGSMGAVRNPEPEMEVIDVEAEEFQQWYRVKSEKFETVEDIGNDPPFSPIHPPSLHHAAQVTDTAGTIEHKSVDPPASRKRTNVRRAEPAMSTVNEERGESFNSKTQPKETAVSLALRKSKSSHDTQRDRLRNMNNSLVSSSESNVTGKLAKTPKLARKKIQPPARTTESFDSKSEEEAFDYVNPSFSDEVRRDHDVRLPYRQNQAIRLPTVASGEDARVRRDRQAMASFQKDCIMLPCLAPEVDKFDY